MVLALFAFALASAQAKDPDMIVVIDLLDSISKINPKTIDKILNTENLTKLDKMDPKMAQLAQLLERISQIDWADAYVYSIENQLTFGKQLNVDGKKVDMEEIFELLARIAGINWTKFRSLFGNRNETINGQCQRFLIEIIIHLSVQFKVAIKPTAPTPATNPSNRQQLDLAKLKKRVDRMTLNELNKFVASSKKLDIAKLKERIDRLCLIELDKFVASSKRQSK